MKTSNFRDQRGFSLIEVLIVLVVIGILATLAVLQLRGARVDMERQRVVREFKNYLERARFDSVKRRADTPAQMATLVLTGPTAFTATMDFDESGTIVPSETRLIDFSQRTSTQIRLTDTLTYPITIRFNRRGQPTVTDGSTPAVAVNPVFRICGNCGVGSPDASFISISPSGTVADTRTAPTTLAAPTVTNANMALNCYVLVVNTNSACINF
jgi:prepilin-type N-terminal cleavage/methylation domain-containing protein